MRRRQREGGRKCQGRVGLKTAGEFPVSHVGEGRTYIFDGVLVNFGFCLPQMMPIYWQKNKVQRLVWLIMSCILIYKQDGPLMGGGYNLQILVPVKRQRCLICGVGVSASCLVPCWNYCCLHALKLYSVAFFFFFCMSIQWFLRQIVRLSNTMTLAPTEPPTKSTSFLHLHNVVWHTRLHVPLLPVPTLQYTVRLKFSHCFFIHKLKYLTF